MAAPVTDEKVGNLYARLARRTAAMAKGSRCWNDAHVIWMGERSSLQASGAGSGCSQKALTRFPPPPHPSGMARTARLRDEVAGAPVPPWVLEANALYLAAIGMAQCQQQCRSAAVGVSRRFAAADFARSGQFAFIVSVSCRYGCCSAIQNTAAGSSGSNAFCFERLGVRRDSVPTAWSERATRSACQYWRRLLLKQPAGD